MVSQISNTRLFVQQFVHANIKENTKAPNNCPFVRKSTGDDIIPLTKGQLCGKRFHNHYIIPVFKTTDTVASLKYTGLIY